MVLWVLVLFIGFDFLFWVACLWLCMEVFVIIIAHFSGLGCPGLGLCFLVYFWVVGAGGFGWCIVTLCRLVGGCGWDFLWLI